MSIYVYTSVCMDQHYSAFSQTDFDQACGYRMHGDKKSCCAWADCRDSHADGDFGIVLQLD